MERTAAAPAGEIAEPAIAIAPPETATTAEKPAVAEAGVAVVAPAARLAFLVEVRGVEGGIRVLPAASAVFLPAAAIIAIDVSVGAGIDVVVGMAGLVGVGLAGLAVGHRRRRLSGAAAIDVPAARVLDVGAGAGIGVGVGRAALVP